jgi:hypothetical protein
MADCEVFLLHPPAGDIFPMSPAVLRALITRSGGEFFKSPHAY